MRIAVADDGGMVSEHFGHCRNYAIFLKDGGSVTKEEDLASPGHEPGKLPLFLASHGVDLVIAGGMGPRAVELFHQNNIEVLLGASGDVNDVVQSFVTGTLEAGESTCHHTVEEPHHSDVRTICITSQGEGLTADAEERFGRSPFFVFLEMDSGKATSTPNPLVDASGGAGPQAVQFVSERGANIVITGQLGNNAAEAMATSGIKAYSYKNGGSVSDAVRMYLEGALLPLN